MKIIIYDYWDASPHLQTEYLKLQKTHYFLYAYNDELDVFERTFDLELFGDNPYRFISLKYLGENFKSPNGHWYEGKEVFQFNMDKARHDKDFIDLIEKVPIGIFDAMVYEIPKGEKYRICNDGRGSEWLEVQSHIQWHIAMN